MKMAKLSESGILVLLAVTAETGPRHSFKTRFGYRTLAHLAFSIPALTDTTQRLFNRPQQVRIASMYLNMQRRFSVCICLICEVANRACRSEHAEITVGKPGG